MSWGSKILPLGGINLFGIKVIQFDELKCPRLNRQDSPRSLCYFLHLSADL